MSPVLWPIYFKVDGSTVQLTDAGTLNGSATITGTAGSLGNLGVTAFAPLDPNLGGLADTAYWIAIPQVIGQWSDQVIPIPVPPSLQPLLGPDQPAIFGAVAVLMKAGAVEEDALEAGHAALNSGVQAALDTLISNIGPGHPDITQADIDAIVPGVQSQVQQAIEGAMDTPDKISAYFNPAQFIGDAIVHFSQDDFPDPGDNTPFSPTFQFFGPIEIDGSVSVLSPCVAQAVTARMADPPADALAAMREFRDGGGLARQPGFAGLVGPGVVPERRDRSPCSPSRGAGQIGPSRARSHAGSPRGWVREGAIRRSRGPRRRPGHDREAWQRDGTWQGTRRHADAPAASGSIGVRGYGDPGFTAPAGACMNSSSSRPSPSW